MNQNNNNNNNGNRPNSNKLNNRTKAQNRDRNTARKQDKFGVNKFQKQLAMPTEVSYAPVSKTKVIKTGKPKMSMNVNGDCIIKHREYVQEISSTASTTTFALSANLPINPAQPQTFQWLSKIAQNFESYRFRKLKFFFETEQSTAQIGTLVMAVDYDATDPAPTSKQQMMAFRNSVRTSLWNGCEHSSQQEDLHKLKMNYIRPGSQPSNTDLKLYDIGNLFIFCLCTSLGAGAVIGELWVEYEVELITPVYENSAGDSESDLAVGTTGQTGAKPMGTALQNVSGGIVQASNGQSLTTFSNVGAGTFTFNKSFRGLMIMEYVGTVITAIAATTGTATQVQLGASADVGALLATQVVSVVASQGSTVILGALTATTVTSGTIRLVSYPVGTLV